jgi:site-specific recombinase XerD
MLLSVAIKQFLNRYFIQAEYSKKTISSYSCDLKQFKEFLRKDINLSEVSLKDFENWILELKKKSYASATIQRKIISQKIFFNYWVRNEKLVRSPTWQSRFHFGKNQIIPKSLTISESKFLIRQARKNHSFTMVKEGKQNYSDLLSLRNLAIIELMFATGLRVGEIHKIKLQDINLNERSIFIRGKGNRYRFCFLTEEKSYQTFIKYHELRVQIDTNHKLFFINRFLTPLSTQGIANLITKISQQAKISKHITPHMLRHTAATFFLRNGADIRVVQEFLGHASISTTQRYTHISKEHLIDNLKSYHPLKQLNN